MQAITTQAVADALSQFRRQCEHSAGQSAANIDISLLDVLADVCQVLHLPAQESARVIGRRGAAHLARRARSRMTTPESRQVNKGRE